MDLFYKIAGGVVALLLAIIAFLLRSKIKQYDKQFDDLEERADKLHDQIDAMIKEAAAKVEACRVTRQTATDGATGKLRDELSSLKSEMSSLREAIPERYLPRTDFIRGHTILEGKIMALFRKFDRIEAKLDAYLELEQDPDDDGVVGSNGGG